MKRKNFLCSAIAYCAYMHAYVDAYVTRFSGGLCFVFLFYLVLMIDYFGNSEVALFILHIHPEQGFPKRTEPLSIGPGSLKNRRCATLLTSAIRVEKTPHMLKMPHSKAELTKRIKKEPLEIDHIVIT